MSQITNQQIFDLLQEVKQQNRIIQSDIQSIKGDLSSYREKIQDLEIKVCELESENFNLKRKFKYLEESTKKNQIIVFGLKEETEDFLEKRVLKLFCGTLSVNIQPQNIDNIYRIGKKGNNTSRPIIIRFVRFLDKQLILKNLSKLKGTGISITNDLTPEQQEDQKILYKYYKIAKSKEFAAKINKNQLVVNGESFSIKDLKEAHEESFIDFFINKTQLFRNNSAPATPDSRAKPKDTQTSPHSYETSPKNQVLQSKESEKSRILEKKQTPVTKISTRATTGRTKSTSSGKSADRTKQRT